jgi:hypothetical protein
LTTHLRKKVYYHSAAPTIHLRRPPTCADHPPAPTIHLRRSPTCADQKKSFSFNPVEKAVLIQLSRQSRSHSIRIKKPSSFNPAEKAVLR